MAWASAGVVAPACFFALERRGARGTEVLVRAYLGAALTAVGVPLAFLALSHAGHTGDALGALAGALDRLAARGPPTGLGLGSVFGGLLASVYLYARARTERVLPQAAGLGLGTALLALGALDAGVAVLAGWAASVGLAALAVAWADRRLVSWDPAAPRAGGELSGARAAGCLLAGLLGAGVVAAFAIPGLIEARRSGNEAAAIGALKTIAYSQALFRENDKDEDGELDYAGNVAELAWPGLVDQVLGGGAKQGYLFRVVRSTTTSEFLWAAAADPLIPLVTGDRHFVVNQSGVVFFTTAGPIPLDPADCTIAPGARPLGR